MSTSRRSISPTLRDWAWQYTIPACCTPSEWSRRKSTSCVTITRPAAGCEGEVISIGAPYQASVYCRRDVNASMSEGIRQSQGDVLVQMKGNSHLSGCLF